MMADDLLVAEDLMLLLLDDEHGVPATTGNLSRTLGGAALVDLALNEGIRPDGPPSDPLLRPAYERIVSSPQHVRTLIAEVGADLWDPVVDRLVVRGFVRREERKVLGLFSRTEFPSANSEHEVDMRGRIRAVLQDGADPDDRTAVLIALLSASAALPCLGPELIWSEVVYDRAKKLEAGNWIAALVGSQLE